MVSNSIINCSSGEIFFLQPGWLVLAGLGVSLMARLATKSQVPGQGKHDELTQSLSQHLTFNI